MTKAAAGLPSFNGTCISFELVNKYKDSWQSHLTRISPFLVCGKDVWWCTDEEGYVFKDGNSDPEYQPAGPNLFHFRDTYLPQVYARQKECWETIIQN